MIDAIKNKKLKVTRIITIKNKKVYFFEEVND